MKHYFYILLLILSTNILANSILGKPIIDHNNTPNKIHADRWLEIDLYWFDHSNMEKSAMEFWDRYYPLMNGIDGWKGVILNVGWISDYILEWQGDLNQEIKFPKNMKAWGWIKDEGQLAGSTLERIQLWKDRFEKLGKPKVINYDTWTYADLKKMVLILKNVARDKYNLNDIKIGTSVLGFQSVYGGEKSEFSKRHPNSFMNNAPNLEAKLSADPQEYGAYPNGIPEGTPLTEFFGKQWGNLSKALNLDVILLRDSYLGVGIYERLGPYGKTAPADPKKVASWSRATADLVKQTKLANPQALVIGYSNAASAVADWRVNCMDLEAIAKEGYLDGYIDQTWAGAWNEVGQRPDGFWNNQLRGWTYQLSNLLIHAAVLADTKVHHCFVTETFDAWEMFDIIHNSQEKLRWGIWAYSHAAVKTPKGLKMPSGSCISWCNKGKILLSKEDVSFIAKTTNAAFFDAQETKEVFGPTMVYCRSAMEWKSGNRPDQSIKEWIDEQTGTLMKWAVPVMSVTRSEYLPNVESDMFIFQTPVNLKQSEKKNIIKILESGKPVAVFGSPAGGLDKDISEIIGVSTTDTVINKIRYNGTLNYHTEGIYNSLPNTFLLFQPFTQNKFAEGVETIYSVSNSPCLGYNQLNGEQLIFWDAPEFFNNLPGESGSEARALDQILGSPVPYVLTARLINEMMKKSGLVYVDEIKQYQPINLTMWQLKDGSYKIMAGNLEEGINHTADHTVHTVLNLPQQSVKEKSTEVLESWNGAKTIIGSPKLYINLIQAQTKLFIIK
ncbi:MAG: hypothetical protein JJE17_01375 [Peptostreptococcaceae bacterium]|nr:hypothetical protein [Peptostreptococcaceae bacterium]